MNKNLAVGQTYEMERIVTPEVSAAHYGNVGVDVFATPAMIGWLEEACHKCIMSALEEGQGTVGTQVNVRHLAATPVGMKVVSRAEVIEIDRRRVVFKVEAHDEQEQIAKGTHERFIIKSIEKFMAKTMAKGK
ncbi:MAG: thioesterase family protein [Ardenticatenaceae bacterium]